MARKEDLEASIREACNLIREHEATIRTTRRPESRLESQRAINHQWSLIPGYLEEYLVLAGQQVPEDIAQVARLVEVKSDIEGLREKKRTIERQLWGADSVVDVEPVDDGGTQRRCGALHTILIIVTALSLVSALVFGILYIQERGSRAPTVSEVLVRVADGTGASVAGANVMLFFSGGPVSEYTDSNGVATLKVEHSGTIEARLIVQTDQYAIYEREIQLPRDRVVDARLSERAAGTSSVIVRVVDDTTSVPIPGAEVLLMAEGDVYSQATDSNGITRFDLAFSRPKLDAQVSITTRKYDIEYQRVTLLPNQVQDIRLNPSTGVLRVTTLNVPDAQVEETSQTSSMTPGPSIRFGQTVTDTIALAGQTNSYPFTGSAGDVALAAMGRASGDLYPELQLYDPQGNLLGSHSGNYLAEVTATLAVEGIYTIVASDGYNGARTGGYGFSFQQLNSSVHAIPLTSGQPVSGALDTAGQIDAYTFEETAGTTVVISMGRASGDLYPKLRLYGPEGSLLNTHSDNYSAEIKESLSTDGAHTILVSDGYNGTRTGEYGLSLQKLP